MGFYIQFGENGVLVTRFDDNKAYLPHPTGTVKVDKALWIRTINETDGQWVRDDNGDITKRPPPPPSQSEIDAQLKISDAKEAEVLKRQAINELLDWAEENTTAALKSIITAFKTAAKK